MLKATPSRWEVGNWERNQKGFPFFPSPTGSYFNDNVFAATASSLRTKTGR